MADSDLDLLEVEPMPSLVVRSVKATATVNVKTAALAPSGITVDYDDIPEIEPLPLSLPPINNRPLVSPKVSQWPRSPQTLKGKEVEASKMPLIGSGSRSGSSSGLKANSTLPPIDHAQMKLFGTALVASLSNQDMHEPSVQRFVEAVLRQILLVSEEEASEIAAQTNRVEDSAWPSFQKTTKKPKEVWASAAPRSSLFSASSSTRFRNASKSVAGFFSFEFLKKSNSNKALGKEIKGVPDTLFDIDSEAPNFAFKLRAKPALHTKVNEFTTNFLALEGTLEDKANTYREFKDEFILLWEAAYPMDDPPLIADLLELNVMQEVYPNAFPRDGTEVETAFATCISSWGDATPEQLGVNPAVAKKMPWAIISSELQQVEAEITTFKKLLCLAKCCKLAADGIKQGMGGHHQGADDLIPVLTYLIIQSTVQSKQKLRLKANLEFISQYRGEERLLDALGYCYISFSIASAYLETTNRDAEREKSGQIEVIQPSAPQNVLTRIASTLSVNFAEASQIILLSISFKTYDARIRHALKFATKVVGFSEEFLAEEGESLATTLIEQSSASIERSEENNASSKYRIAKVVGATLIGGVIIGATGGLLAPLVGGALSGLGLGGVIAGMAALTGLKGAALASVVFGVAGATISANKARKQTAGIEDFILEKTDTTGLHVTIGVMGWLVPVKGNKDRWAETLLTLKDPGALYILMWEVKKLLSFGEVLTAFLSKLDNIASHWASGSIPRKFYSATLKVGLKIDRQIVAAWSEMLETSKKVGYVLALEIVSGCFGARPITLIGTSMGARVIYYCLKQLMYLHEESKVQTQDDEKKKNILSLIEAVVIIGCPVALPGLSLLGSNDIQHKNWTAIRSLVAGRFVNCYNPNDVLFDSVYSNSQKLAGNAPVMLENFMATGTSIELPPLEFKIIENVDVGEVAMTHLDYNKKEVVEKILDHIKLHSCDSCPNYILRPLGVSITSPSSSSSSLLMDLQLPTTINDNEAASDETPHFTVQ